MGDPRIVETDGGALRRWSFGACVFDEAEWSLRVNGRRVKVEIKPLMVLRELLVNAGKTVSKDHLLASVWPNVTVVDASLPTAIYKLRNAIGKSGEAQDVIETVPALGYRIAVPVRVEEGTYPSPTRAATGPLPVAAPINAALRKWALPGAALALAAALLAVWPQAGSKQPPQPAPPPSASEVREALRKLDVEAVEGFIARGWKPASPFDTEGDALTTLLNQCEWDRSHDRRKMLMIARILIEAGAPIDRRNIYGDTAYSIAKAPRYCGPDHPVTQMLEAMCYGGDLGPKDLCLATYELTPAQRRAQGLPAK